MRHRTSDLIHDARILRKKIIRLCEEVGQVLMLSAELIERVKQAPIRASSTLRSVTDR
jgi:hypothetical protein